MRLLLVLGWLAVVAVAYDCGFSCLNGYCNEDDECVCDDHYAGDDCSVYVYDLSPTVPITGHVNRSDYMYFTLESLGPDQHWALTRTGSGDCDLYIGFERPPTNMQYIARNISFHAEMEIVLEYQPEGLYYGGVYGYSGCDFSIRASYCAKSCGLLGLCNDGQCHCDGGYVGEDCNAAFPELQANGPALSGSVGREWTYFSFVASESYSELDWIIESDEHKTITMAVKEGDTPTVWTAEYVSVFFPGQDQEFINQSFPVQGSTYYFGALGGAGCDYTSCEFTIRVRAQLADACPNACSLHSDGCRGSTCSCQADYDGLSCETYTPEISVDSLYYGYVGTNAWNYYHFTGNSMESVLVRMNVTSSSGKSVMYVNSGSEPTTKDYVYTSRHDPTHITVLNPLGEVWYIGIYGRSPYQYVLEITHTTMCACGPGAHGHCVADSTTCLCASGYVGDDCEEEVVVLQSGVPRTNEMVKRGEWDYFVISVTGSTAFSLTAKESYSTGLCWVFISHTEFPTMSSYDYSDKSTNSPVHQVSFFTNIEQTGDIFIGIYGSTFIPEQAPNGTVVEVPYEIVAWVSDF